MSTLSKTTKMKLKQVPKHIRGLVIDEQARRNKDCFNCRISQEKTIYRIIEDWAKLKEIDFINDEQPEVTIETE